jgi:hypothetical protein
MIVFKKMIGLLLGLLPFAIVIILSVYDGRLFKAKAAIVGYVLYVLGGFISCINFYSSFLRYYVYKLTGKMDKYRFESGIPLFGFLAVIGMLFMPKSFLINFLVFIFLIIDTGGIQWFVVCTWRDKVLWRN